MWNNKSNKGVSLVEAMVAIFILGVIAAIVLNSSSTFTRSQQTLISHNRKDQMADLILQDIMEYTKFQNNLYGTITADYPQTFGYEDDTIAVSGVNLTSIPQPGDMFLVDGVPGRYIVKSFSQSGLSGTITSETNFPEVSIGDDDTAISFIAFKKQNLNCFSNLDLSGAVPATCPDESSMPSKVIALFNHWNSEIDDELGTQITTRQIEVTADSLVKVTLGEGTNDTVLARKINNCIFQEGASTVAFTFPGKDAAVITGIMQGNEDPVQHYYNDAKAQHREDGSWVDTPVSCERTQYSTCRQNYAGSNTISVFLYKYTGADITVKPSKCNNGVWEGQCDEVEIDTNDLSLWFIFDEYNHPNNDKDFEWAGVVGGIPGSNQGGYLYYEISSLPNAARIVIFDDSAESCQGSINGGKCTGQYKWNSAHDGLVVNLGTSDLKTLSDIQLEIKNIPFGIKSWRVLKTDDGCKFASGAALSTHGGAWDVEPTVDDPASCWDEVKAEETKLKYQLEIDEETSMTVVDSTIFPAQGEVQVGNELISYQSKAPATVLRTIDPLTGEAECAKCGVLSELGRGMGRKQAQLTEQIDASGGPGTEDWANQILNESADGLILGDPEIGFLGGYLKIDNEIFKADYSNDFQRRLDDNIHFTGRAQLGTTAQAHAIGATVNNFDTRKQTWKVDTPVYEGELNSIAVVEAELSDSEWDDTSNATFPRVRIKKKVSLNLSTAEVCQ